MIPAVTDKDRQQLKEHALKLLNAYHYEGLVILVEELEDTDFELPKGLNTRQKKSAILRGAASNGHLKIVKYLVSLGADPHDKEEQAVQWASGYGHLEVVKYFVEQGVDATALKESLKAASRNKRENVVDYLKSIIDK